MTQDPEFDQLSCDGFLGGRLRIRQPLRGYRAATDPVFLAASVPARAGQSVLDIGCGVGVAALCLACRISGLDLHGLEIQPGYAELARRNGVENGIRFSVHDGDVAAMPAGLRQRSFDHVIMNMPYFRTGTATGPENTGKCAAHQAPEGSVAIWVGAALKRLVPGGYISLIHRAENVGEILAALHGVTGDGKLLPISPRSAQAARRVLVQARKGRRGELRILWPLVVHSGETHQENNENFTKIANSILREAQNLPLKKLTRD